MAFAIMGTVGTVRHRSHPKKAETRGPRGVVNKHSKRRDRKVELDARRTFDFARTTEKTSVFKRALNKVRSVFARGNR